jgi:hypothetical protein
MISDLAALKAKYKPAGMDISLDTARDHYEYVSIKRDGWWSVMEVANGVGQVYSVSGTLIATLPMPPLLRCVMIGETMIGTNRAVNDPDTYGSFWAFDYVDNISNYIARYTQLIQINRQYNEWVQHNSLPAMWRICALYPITYIQYLMNEVNEHGLEGLVFRNTMDYHRLPRYKPLVTQDYVCMGMIEGNGRLEGTLGSIVGGKYVDGKLVEICRVGGGLTDAKRIEYWNDRLVYLGQVFEAEGRQLFTTGALRHPNFLRWRNDKEAKECIWPIP